jgi:hypothetical protein
MLDSLALQQQLHLVFSSFQKAVLEKEDNPCVGFFFFGSVAAAFFLESDSSVYFGTFYLMLLSIVVSI